MNTRMLFARTIALTLIGSAIVPQIAKADIPMKIAPGRSGWTITVPDEDTTVPAYGGRLRKYDVHIAKMIEVTSLSCKQSPRNRTLSWTYRADNGAANMGTFAVSCGLVWDLFDAYGTGKSEETQFVDSDGSTMIPTLNITGGKVDKWIRFTNNFKPIR
jgi:hypothetical protein